MKNLALITGASSGIGAELAQIHASRKGDLILVARRKDELERLADDLRQKHGVQVKVMVKDLSVNGASKELIDELGALVTEVEVLMNNAGFGGFGNFADRPLEKEQEMIRLNITALTDLTHLVIPHMIKKGRGRILNTASSAGFMPGPLQAVYFATKAYVVSFTQGIHHELKPHGISVTALCPGPVSTGFEKTAGLEGVDLFKMAVAPSHTAKAGYRGMEKGRMIVFDQRLLSFSVNWLIPFVPRNMVLKMVQKMQTPKKV
jgi:short-subunit dehydrogenase